MWTRPVFAAWPFLNWPPAPRMRLATSFIKTNCWSWSCRYKSWGSSWGWGGEQNLLMIGTRNGFQKQQEWPNLGLLFRKFPQCTGWGGFFSTEACLPCWSWSISPQPYPPGSFHWITVMKLWVFPPARKTWGWAGLEYKRSISLSLLEPCTTTDLTLIHLTTWCDDPESEARCDDHKEQFLS